jgi:3-deoxy-D-manno-octulosonic-acid transferase
MLVAPRHLTRMPSIEKAAERAGVSLWRVSASACELPAHLSANVVFLLDQVGVLAPLYECADVVFIGGSLVKAGGHNLVEPATFAKPILFGPHMDNFLEMAEEFKNGQAAVPVRDIGGLKGEIERLILDPKSMESLGRNAQALARRHQGATEKDLDTVLSVLESKKRSFIPV